ncbi:histidinol-phosphatase HisJ family protein [Thermosipho atlanticus]|uniref:Histidinol-phosphatase n=1 Tax=Thermosipho atlanticus DSM 15807 TaxID=1123380 RepID=A0A1M5TN41_9BACT|nr:histidinol-phosphatase HisJ family protein [Thermosipho atlanticus]SHH52081.1 histidinol-phosphatase (PHP family) [Thermosipho atlanticus DSM 15807]
MIDYHLHSVFSPDSTAKVEDILKKAKEKGIDHIIITDHFEVVKGEHNFKFDVEEYRRTMEKYCLPVGVELGWDGVTDISIDLENFDFVILSLHEFSKPVTQKSYKEYLERILNILTKFDSYHVLGHLDFPRRYSESFEPFSKNLYPILEEIFKLVIEKGKGIEVNTASMLKYGEPNPSYDLLKIYKKLGGEFITIGSDAHRIEDVGQNVEKVAQMLKEIGFGYIGVLKGEWNMLKIGC